ncbi:MAG: RsmE family RNA methyltransferase [bacterium]|nr:RsmE family RNA methyltransferase [bacterium]
MKVHRFIADLVLRPGLLSVEDEDLVHQAKDVLKLAVGERVTFCDGALHEADGEIVSLDKKGMTVDLGAVRENNREATRDVFLYCALLKRDNFEFVVQKATELGVRGIVPVLTDRTIKLGFHADRMQKIAREAAEQSGRGRVPVINEPIAFSEALKESQKHDATYFFDMNGEHLAGSARVSSIGLLIGPEGGWSDAEIGLAQEAKVPRLSFFARTLRAETAAMAAVFWSLF